MNINSNLVIATDSKDDIEVILKTHGQTCVYLLGHINGVSHINIMRRELNGRLSAVSTLLIAYTCKNSLI